MMKIEISPVVILNVPASVADSLIDDFCRKEAQELLRIDNVKGTWTCDDIYHNGGNTAELCFDPLPFDTSCYPLEDNLADVYLRVPKYENVVAVEFVITVKQEKMEKQNGKKT